MHGRLKVKTTAEQAEAKRKEREKKLKLYRAGTAIAFGKREKREYDNELLSATAELLGANPDFYTLWNIRREAFLHLKENDSEEVTQTSLESELSFLEQCLRINPKSYGTWHHRGWVLDNMPEPNWKRELLLCNKFLEYDERNFHCWDYRRFVVQRAEVSPEEELEFTTNKIETNFSNYSSWHYRSKILPLVHGDTSHPVGIKSQKRVDECLLAQNAFFTDPSDQSAWFYHRWLLGRVVNPLRLESIFVGCKQPKIVVSLSQHIRISEKHHKLRVRFGESKQNVDWRSVTGDVFSQIWTSSTINISDMTSSTSICVAVEDQSGGIVDQQDVSLASGQDSVTWRRAYAPGRRFCQELSAVTSEVLEQELEMLQQLHELEPDNKWVLLTLLSIVRALDPLKYDTEAEEYIGKLVCVDPARCNYYIDLRSKYRAENAIEQLSHSCTALDLSGQNLTILSHSDHLVTMESIDLSKNSMKTLQDGCMLQCVKRLNMDDNDISSCQSLQCLDSLEELSICNNKLSCLEDLKPLTSCSHLTRLLLQNNPVCDSCDHDAIKALFSGVDVIC